jgi:hypothetical protein
LSQQINLFNPIFRKQKKYFSSTTMAQALAIICVACALLAADAARRSRALQAQAASVDALLVASQERLADFRVRYAPRQKSATLAAEIATAQQELTMLAEAQSTIVRGGFGDTRGFSNYFRAFARQSIDGLWLTGLDIGARGDRLGVRGNAMQAELVPQYMRRLATEPILQGKAFSSLRIEPGAPAAAAPAAAAPVAAPAYLRFSLQSVPAPAAAAEGGK